MIRLRQAIERGMRNRWIGPLFVVLFCVMMALLFFHDAHEGHNVATEVGDFCVGLTVMFGVVVLIRLRWRTVVPIVLVRLGRAPPAPQPVAFPASGTACVSAPPLRL